MILGEKKIKECIDNGEIIFFNDEDIPMMSNELHIGPNSVDLYLQQGLFTYKACNKVGMIIDPEDEDGMKLDLVQPVLSPSNQVRYLLEPNKIYLACTVERVYSPNHVPMLEGRSSLARLGISVHHSAGFGDVGFNGKWTLEISCQQPTYIYPNTRVCQVFFLNIDGKGMPYQGKYQNSKRTYASKFMMDYKGGLKDVK